MAFSDLIASMDGLILNTFQKTEADVPTMLTIHFDNGDPDLTVQTVVKNPTMEEDYAPGSTQGTSMLILFVRFSSTNSVQHGATATYGGVDYDIGEVNVDREGGATMKLRRRTQAYNG